MPTPPNDMDTSDTDFLSALTFEPLSKANWNQFVKLFGKNGACGNCWCMWPRLGPTEYAEGKMDNGNKEAMRSLVQEGKPTGILAFFDGEPIAWCAFAPREDYLKLKRSRVHKPIDDAAVWSIMCNFIAKPYRKMGVSVALLHGVIDYARSRGIRIIEAYPNIPTTQKLPDSFVWMGLYKSFERAGFKIVDRSSKNKPMVRFVL